MNSTPASDKYIEFARRDYIITAIWIVAAASVFHMIDKNWIHLIFCLIIYVGFTAWGHVLVYPLFYKHQRYLDGFIWGCVLGVAIGTFLISICVYYGGWELYRICLILIILPATILIYQARKYKTVERTELSREQNYDILFCALIVVTLFFYFPYRNYGALSEDKHVYAWLFGHDFNNRLVFLAGLSRKLPLESYHFSGEILSYYWLAYIYPALILNIDWIKLDTAKIFQFTVLFYSWLTTASLFVFSRNLVRKRKKLFILFLIIFCCYSYMDLYVIAERLYQLISGKYRLEALGFDLSRFSGFSHTFYRFFLVQPHATLGISLMLLILSLYRVRNDLYHYIIIGLCAGLLFGVDATNGIMIGLWLFCSTLFYIIVLKRTSVSIVVRSFCLACVSIAVYILLFTIKMYSLKTGQGVLKINPNIFSLTMGIGYIPVEYGPALLLGIIGVSKAFKNKEPYTHPVYTNLILFSICMFFVFFITNPAEGYFGLLKATRIIPLCLIVFVAYYLNNAFLERRERIIVYILLIIAFPTIFIDNYIASNVSHPASTYIKISDKKAAWWIKSNIPKDAIVQAEPNYPGEESYYKPEYYYSFIPVFAERRTAVGEWKVSSLEHSSSETVRERYDLIDRMFSTTDIIECANILKKYDISYVYLGELEKQKYPKGTGKFLNNPDIFENVYSSDSIDIVRFIPLQPERL